MVYRTMKPIALLLFTVLCASAQTAFQISETAGIARTDEPVKVTVNGSPTVLYVTIGAKETKTVKVDEARPKMPLKTNVGDRVGFFVENSQFLADLSGWYGRGRLEDSGTLRTLVYRQFGAALLRSQNRMHWAPSLQRPNTNGYSSIGTWHPVQWFERSVGNDYVTLHRRGHHQDYPEVEIDATYEFFADVPYFLFESTMTVKQPTDLYWLRNQEMTMDKNFTHVAWAGPDGKPQIYRFDEQIPVMEKNPIPADVPWLCFFDENRGFGYGAVILAYEATTTAGAKHSINIGVNDARYWDRHLISKTNTKLKPGDRYYERTAYVLFPAPKGDPLKEFLEWGRRIRNPLKAQPAP